MVENPNSWEKKSINTYIKTQSKFGTVIRDGDILISQLIPQDD
jgi:hypothetical protein